MTTQFVYKAIGVICLVAVTYAAPPNTNSCPREIPQVFCFRAPCQPAGIDVCVGNVNATCRPDACFNCGNHFIDEHGNRLSDFTCSCPPEKRSFCLINPCNPIVNTKGCQSTDPDVRSNAKCEAYTCGGCDRRWYIDEVDRSYSVTSLCEKPANSKF